MKAHLALRCSMVIHSVKLEYLHIVTNENISEQTVQNQSKNQLNKGNNNFDFARTDRALVRFFVCCKIPFSVVDSPFFQDFVKSLCYAYESPRRTALSSNLLNAETANIALKIKEELCPLKNLTLGQNIFFIGFFFINI